MAADDCPRFSAAADTDPHQHTSGAISILDGNRGYQRIGGQLHACGSENTSPYDLDFDPALNKLHLAWAETDNVDLAVISSAVPGGLAREATLRIGNGGPNGGECFALARQRRRLGRPVSHGHPETR